MSAFHIKIRRMLETDIDEVYLIEQSTFSTPWSKESILNDIKNNPCARYLVVESDDKIIAYAGIWIILDEGHITNIAVLEPFRGLKIGEKLFKALLLYASNLGISYITLEVRKSNIIAQSLYKKFGFVTVNIRKKYYEDNGEDACLMVCDCLPDASDDFDDGNFVLSYYF